MSVQTDLNQCAILTPEQREFFDTNGYLAIENALPQDVVAEIDAAIDEIHEREEKAGHLEPSGQLNVRNCITQHDAFFQLLDWPSTAPLAWGILNWNIQMITSHLLVLPSKEEPPPEVKNKIGLHRDGGTSPREMQEPHPRILLKIAYAISDQSDTASGATVLVPGSNRLTGTLAVDSETGMAQGTTGLENREKPFSWATLTGGSNRWTILQCQTN